MEVREKLTQRSRVCLTLTLVLRRESTRHFPVSSLYESLIFLSLLFVYFLLVFRKANFSFPLLNSKYTQPKNLFQNLISSILAVCPVLILGFASFCLPLDLQKRRPLVPALKSNWLFIHVTVILISYAGLLIGSLFSIIFLLTDALSLNTKQWFAVFLETLDGISYRLILFSYPFLTLGILSGAIWANETWGSYWNWDPKETWSLITWLLFTAYLHQRLILQRKGKTSAFISRIGFRRVWISYLGVNLLGKGLHSYGWFISLGLNYHLNIHK